jgi:hypothetical protein
MITSARASNTVSCFILSKLKEKAIKKAAVFTAAFKLYLKIALFIR